MNNTQAFKDGQTFYIPAPGCDEKIRWQMLEDDIKNAFSSPEELREKYKGFPRAVDDLIAYYENYRLGILDKMANYPQIVPPKVKKILAFVFDGKVYSSNEKSIWNGSNWMEFCEYMKN